MNDIYIKAAELYLSGCSLSEIAYLIDKSPWAIRNHLQKMNIKMNRRGLRKGYRHRSTLLKLNDILSLRKNHGYTLQSIADIYGVSRQAIHHMISKNDYVYKHFII